MAFTQADLDELNKAIALGAVRVKYADRDVTYRSLDDLRSARDEVARALGQVPSSGNLRAVYPRVSKDLG